MFEALLKQWNTAINLVSAREIDALWERHIGDSLGLLPFLPPAAELTDLGSGAGFPGLVLAIATDRPTTLVEADQRKAAFLREVVRVTGAPVHIVPRRIEVCGLTERPLLTARALAPLPRLLALAAPLLASSGVCLFLKGQNVEPELTAAKREWQMSINCHTRPDSKGSVVLEVRHLRRIQPEPL